MEGTWRQREEGKSQSHISFEGVRGRSQIREGVKGRSHVEEEQSQRGRVRGRTQVEDGRSQKEE